MTRTVASSVSQSDQRSMFEEFPAMLCTARFDGLFIEVNEALEAALGYKAGEMPAKLVRRSGAPWGSGGGVGRG